MADYYCDLFTKADGSVGWHRFGLPQMHVRAFDAHTYLWRDHQTDVVHVSHQGVVRACGGKA